MDPNEKLSPEEQQEVSDRAAPRSPVIYQVVRRQGEEELERPWGSLFWSGLAAGIAIMSSVIAEGALHHKLPPGLPGREVLSDLGYSLGFLIVVLGRMQLFTEQTIVTVLPVMAEPGWHKLLRTGRLWAIVFGANMLGTCVAALMNVHFGLMNDALLGAMLEISERLLHHTPLELVMQGIPAGFLVAAIAWIRAGSEGSEFLVVLVLTYAIALGDFAHVVAGSAEAFLLVFNGQAGLGEAIGLLILPTLLGNILGGTGLFALLAYAQVREEI